MAQVSYRIVIMSLVLLNSLNDSSESSINMHVVTYSGLEGFLLKKGSTDI